MMSLFYPNSSYVAVLLRTALVFTLPPVILCTQPTKTYVESRSCGGGGLSPLAAQLFSWVWGIRLARHFASTCPALVSSRVIVSNK